MIVRFEQALSGPPSRVEDKESKDVACSAAFVLVFSQFPIPSPQNVHHVLANTANTIRLAYARTTSALGSSLTKISSGSLAFSPTYIVPTTTKAAQQDASDSVAGAICIMASCFGCGLGMTSYAAMPRA